MSSGVERQSPELLAGRWQVDRPLRLLGAGAYAQTFAGTAVETGDPIAIKLLKEAAPDDARARFAREASVHAGLKHAAILPLLDHGRDGAYDYLVTPLMRRGSLDHVVHAQPDRRLPPRTALQIARRMTDALDYLQQQRTTHGDISPANILLDDHDRALLADFGYSKAVATLPLATTSDRFGTEGFRAPRPRGEQRSHEDDVFSLAAVLWFCLTGHPPDAAREHLPRALRAPLERALRWGAVPTAAQFRADIERHWSRYEDDWRLVSSPSPRSRLPLALACGLAGLAVSGVAGQELRASPPQVPHTTLHGSALTLRLGDRWQERLPPAIAGLQMRSAVSATNADVQVTVGLASSMGQALIGPAAVAALPAGARTPRRIIVDKRQALRYGPARTRSGRVTELIAMPLERSALVVSCDGTGTTTTLRAACAKAAAGADPLQEDLLALAPRPAVASELRAAARTLATSRGQAAAQMSAVTTAEQLRVAARRLALAYTAYAAAVRAVRASAQERRSIDEVATAAAHAGAAYDQLADATDEQTWSLRRSRALARERGLATTLGRLATLGYVTSR